jgi:methylated-DNA-[protein]-cysteine S-methyltransferase
MELFQHEFDSPVGLVYVVSDGTNLRVVEFEGHEDRWQRQLARYYEDYTLHTMAKPNDAIARLKDYFAGDLHAVDDLSVATNGTAFQQQVWAALRTIPTGTTVSYGTIAARIGRPTAFRAVGLANGSNPVAIVVPCHRVIGSDNSLTGYGGGLERKQWLLRHEGVALPADTARPRHTQRGNQLSLIPA